MIINKDFSREDFEIHSCKLLMKFKKPIRGNIKK